MAEKRNDEFKRKDDPKELIKLCTECKRSSCNGDPCDAYLAMERSLKSERKAKKSVMTLEPIAPDASEMIGSSSGLRLLNLSIDALYGLIDEDSIKEDEAMYADLNRMISVLDEKRFRLYGYRVDWYEYELMEERGACG